MPRATIKCAIARSASPLPASLALQRPAEPAPCAQFDQATELRTPPIAVGLKSQAQRANRGRGRAPNRQWPALAATALSETGHSRQFDDVHVTSALPLIADVGRKDRHVRFAPKPEVASSLRRHWHGKKTAGFQTNVPVHPGARRSRRGRRGSAVIRTRTGGIRS
jgi:hypothetical protein